MALPLSGKKRKLTKDILLLYFGQERLKLSDKTIEKTLQNLSDTQTEWQRLLSVCFLSDEMKVKYKSLLEKRLKILYK
jgi:serine/threonine-protein kinase HipA